MTEAAWLSSTDVRSMLRHLDGKVSMRKMRLFAIACCRRVEYLMTDEDEPGREALDFAETMIDEQVDSNDMRHAQSGAWYAGFRLIDGFRFEPELNARSNAIFAVYETLEEADDPIWRWRASMKRHGRRSDLMEAPTRAQRAAGFASVTEPFSPEGKTAEDIEQREQILILRDIFGNPFRKTRIDLSWLEWNIDTVGRLAEGIYDERGFERLPILADALKEAGCTNGEMLDHCREPGAHMRGCWVVDLLLGKA